MEKECSNQECKNVFSKQTSDSKNYWAMKRFCSIACSGTNFKKGRIVSQQEKENLSKLNTGSNNKFWKGGTRHITAQGYVVIYAPGYPRNKCLEHRYVIEKHLGRKLAHDEHVHHLNSDKTDNRLENLAVIDRKEHGRAHAMQRWHNESVKGL
jgi:hypothetical protein